MNIYNEQGQMLLRKGTMLIPELVTALKDRGIESVYILDDISDDSEETVQSGPYSPLQKKDLETVGGVVNEGFFNKSLQVISELERTLLRGQYNTIIQEDLSHSLVDLLTIVFSTDEVKQLDYLLNLKIKHSNYSYESHSLNTGLLCAMIGRWLGMDMRSIIKVGLTGCLHDIGKSRISQKILTKKEKLNNEEWRLVKQHPIIGARILSKTTWIDPDMLIAVLMHHERLDGSGYPQGYPASKIPIMPRIIAVAGAFDTITSNRPYAPAMNIFKAIAYLRDQSFGQLDSRITRLFYDKILEYYMGRTVNLSNGDQGKIIKLDEKSYRPLIRGSEGYYDLTHKDAPSIIALN